MWLGNSPYFFSAPQIAPVPVSQHAVCFRTEDSTTSPSLLTVFILNVNIKAYYRSLV